MLVVDDKRHNGAVKSSDKNTKSSANNQSMFQLFSILVSNKLGYFTRFKVIVLISPELANVNVRNL